VGGRGGFPSLVDVATVATLLGVDIRFVRRLVFERRIPYVKVGRYVRFDVAEVAGWVDEQRVHVYED
jgi:excisionase family DNA binding protein